MKLVHPELSFCIDYDNTESLIKVCVIESPVRWRELQKEMIAQYTEGTGNWVLSEDDKELKFNKAVEMIFNPLQLEENQRKIISVFLKSFADKAVSEEHWRDGQELNSNIQMFFAKLEMEYSFSYHIDPEVDFVALSKAMGLQIEADYTSDLDRLVQYCIMVKELLHPRLFVFWNLRSYFLEEEIEMFYEEVRRREWKVLLMERFLSQKLDGEKCYIIDKDNCEIY